MIMADSSISDVLSLFFKELQQYNSTNFKTLRTAKLGEHGCSAKVNKSFSSVVTRYFIFKEKHPEIKSSEIRMLYYKLCIDKIARYFSEYPAGRVDDLAAFQSELLRFVSIEKQKNSGVSTSDTVVDPLKDVSDLSVEIGA